MNLLISILFWAGIALVVDGSLGILFEDKWKKIAEGLDVQRIALSEIGVGFVLLLGHFVLNYGVYI